MKNLLYLIPLFILVSCNHAPKSISKLTSTPTPIAKNTPDEERKDIQYTDQQLEAYLDSVGHLPTQPLVDKVAFGTDSVFKNQKQLDTLISTPDFKLLKMAALKGVISVKTARRILGNDSISYDCTSKSIESTYKRGLIPLVLYPFDKNKDDWNEFAICVGNPGNCRSAVIYFFKSNKIIARHNGYLRFGAEPEHYKDVDGKTIVYTVEWFDEGSGIWWMNFFFYKYEGDKLIPVLDELQNANIQGLLGSRALWLESTILKTNPLTLKMVYYSQFADTSSTTGAYGPQIINDSTTVQYLWDERSKTLRGQYEKSKISKAQILSYYLDDNDLLFINSYYKTLKDALRDKTKRKLLLIYLNNTKNYYRQH